MFASPMTLIAGIVLLSLGANQLGGLETAQPGQRSTTTQERRNNL
jgi:hypothetical protein